MHYMMTRFSDNLCRKWVDGDWCGGERRRGGEGRKGVSAGSGETGLVPAELD